MTLVWLLLLCELVCVTLVVITEDAVFGSVVLAVLLGTTELPGGVVELGGTELLPGGVLDEGGTDELEGGTWLDDGGGFELEGGPCGAGHDNDPV